MKAIPNDSQADHCTTDKCDLFTGICTNETISNPKCSGLP
jgi:hypothetical protein